MPTLGQQIVARLAPALEASLGESAREVADTVRASISDPFPPASDPGSPPHRRKGNLADGVDSEVLSSPGEKRVEASVWSERVDGDPRVPIFLELGTEDMDARPFMQPAYYRTRQRVLRRVGAATGGTPA